MVLFLIGERMLERTFTSQTARAFRRTCRQLRRLGFFSCGFPHAPLRFARGYGSVRLLRSLVELTSLVFGISTQRKNEYLFSRQTPSAFTAGVLPSSLATDRNVSDYFGAGPCGAVNRQSTTNLFGALSHTNQSEMAGGSIARRLIIKTVSVIADAQLHPARIEDEVDQDALGLRVFHRIVDCLLANAQQIIFHQSWQTPEGSVDLDLGLYIRLIRQSSGSFT